jgi:hypothetical protein
VFAERVGHLDVWRDAVKGFSMIESPLIAELLADAARKAGDLARAAGKAEGEVKAKADTLLRVMQKRCWELPEGLTAAIRACTDSNQLDQWLDVALDAQTLEKFRKQTGL